MNFRSIIKSVGSAIKNAAIACYQDPLSSIRLGIKYLLVSFKVKSASGQSYYLTKNILAPVPLIPSPVKFGLAITAGVASGYITTNRADAIIHPKQKYDAGQGLSNRQRTAYCFLILFGIYNGVWSAANVAAFDEEATTDMTSNKNIGVVDELLVFFSNMALFFYFDLVENIMPNTRKFVTGEWTFRWKTFGIGSLFVAGSTFLGYFSTSRLLEKTPYVQEWSSPVKLGVTISSTFSAFMGTVLRQIKSVDDLLQGRMALPNLDIKTLEKWKYQKKLSYVATGVDCVVAGFGNGLAVTDTFDKCCHVPQIGPIFVLAVPIGFTSAYCTAAWGVNGYWKMVKRNLPEQVGGSINSAPGDSYVPLPAEETDENELNDPSAESTKISPSPETSVTEDLEKRKLLPPSALAGYRSFNTFSPKEQPIISVVTSPRAERTLSN